MKWKRIAVTRVRSLPGEVRRDLDIRRLYNLSGCDGILKRAVRRYEANQIIATNLPECSEECVTMGCDTDVARLAGHCCAKDMARSQAEFAAAIALENHYGNAQARNLKPADQISFTERRHFGTLYMRPLISPHDLFELMLRIPLEQMGPERT